YSLAPAQHQLHAHAGGEGFGAGPLEGGGKALQLQQQQQGPGMHCQGNCSCKECCEAKPPSDACCWGAPMDLLPAMDRPRDCVRAALLTGAMLLLAAAVPGGYELAGALLRHLGDTSALLPGLVLRGLALGAACVGIARAAAGSPGWQLPAATAGLLAAACATAVAALLLPLPCGRVPSEDIAFDPGHWADKLQAFAAGGLLLASVGYLWPAAAHYKPRKVQLGVGV
ncbi:hypothetical protein Agub_g13204, partial [Astrephomene gubernaculifera]